MVDASCDARHDPCFMIERDRHPGTQEAVRVPPFSGESGSAAPDRTLGGPQAADITAQRLDLQVAQFRGSVAHDTAVTVVATGRLSHRQRIGKIMQLLLQIHRTLAGQLRKAGQRVAQSQW